MTNKYPELKKEFVEKFGKYGFWTFSAKDGRTIWARDCSQNKIWNFITKVLDAQKQKDKVKIINLRADIAYAIGSQQGLGYPSKYLEKRYPKLSGKTPKS